MSTAIGASLAPNVDTRYDPSKSQDIPANWPSGRRGRLLWWNDTPFGHYISFNASTDANPLYVPAGCARLMTPGFAVDHVHLSVPGSATLINAPQSALSNFVIEWHAVGALPAMPDQIIALPTRLSNTGALNVIANQLGSSQEGVTTALDGTNEAIFPYTNQLPHAARGLELQDIDATGARTTDAQIIHNQLLVNHSLQVVGVSSFDTGGTASWGDDGNGNVSANSLLATGLAPNGLSIQANGKSALDGTAFETDGNGHLANYGGQATAGQGVPPILAIGGTIATPWVAVGVTTDQVIATFTPTAIGLYLVGIRVDLNNGASGQLLKAYVKYTDANTTTSQTSYFFGVDGNATATLMIAGGAVTFLNRVYVFAPLGPLAVAANVAIEVHYQDPGGTPIDRVSAFIMRIA